MQSDHWRQQSTLSAPPPFVFGLVLFSASCSLFYNGNAHYLYELSIAAAFIALAASLHATSGRVMTISFLGLFLTAFVVWSGLSVFWSQVPYVSLVDFGALATAFAIYLIARLSRAGDTPIPASLILVPIGGTIMSAMLAQYFMGFEPRAMFLNRNSAAALVNLAWPMVAIGFIRSNPGQFRAPILVGLLAAMFLAIGLTGSRGATVAAVAGLLILSAAGIFRFRAGRATIIIIIVALTSLLLSSILLEGAESGSIRSLADPGSAGASRFTIWAAAWDMIREAPLLGYGPGVFFLAYPAFRLPADRSAGFFVHNDYLEFWLERGLPGLVLFLGIAIAALWLCMRYIRDNRAPDTHTSTHEGLMIATFTALSTAAVHGVFSYNLQLMPFLILACLLIAEFEHASSQSGPIRILIPPLQRPAAVIMLAAAALVPIWQGATHALYFNKVEAGIKTYSKRDFATAADEFARARAIWSLPDSAWYLQANTHLTALDQASNVPVHVRDRLVRRALALLAEAKARNPLRPGTPLVLGLLRAKYPDSAPGSARDAFRHALRIDPRSIEARYALSQLLERSGEHAAAVELIREGLHFRYPPRADVQPLVRRLTELRRVSRNSEDGFRAGERLLTPKDLNPE